MFFNEVNKGRMANKGKAAVVSQCDSSFKEGSNDKIANEDRRDVDSVREVECKNSPGFEGIDEERENIKESTETDGGICAMTMEDVDVLACEVDNEPENGEDASSDNDEEKEKEVAKEENVSLTADCDYESDFEEDEDSDDETEDSEDDESDNDEADDEDDDENGDEEAKEDDKDGEKDDDHHEDCSGTDNAEGGEDDKECKKEEDEGNDKGAEDNSDVPDDEDVMEDESSADEEMSQLLEKNMKFNISLKYHIFHESFDKDRKNPHMQKKHVRFNEKRQAKYFKRTSKEMQDIFGFIDEDAVEDGETEEMFGEIFLEDLENKKENRKKAKKGFFSKEEGQGYVADDGK